MNRQKAGEVATDMEAAIQEVLTKHGLILEKRTGRYGSSIGTLSVKFDFSEVTSSDDGTEIPSSFRSKCARYGLREEHYGAEFVSFSGERYRIAGINSRARKYPISCKRVRDEKGFKFSAQDVQRYLGV